MAEQQVKKGPNHRKKGKSGDVLSQKMGSMSINPSGDKTMLPLFPARPPRTGLPPGKSVKLLTNLFKMSLLESKPIYRYTVNTNIEEDNNDESKKTGSDKGTEKIPRKLSKEILRLAVDEVVKRWIVENPQDISPKLEFNYVFDNSAANLYALFNMFKKPGDGEARDFRVSIDLPTIRDGALGSEKKYFRVKIFKGILIDMPALFKFCTMKPPNSDIALVQEQIRTLNVILRGKIQTMPFNVMTQTSIFPYTKGNQAKVSEGVIINKGYFMSARPTESGLVLNVANTVAAFHEEVDLVDLLKNRFYVKNLNEPIRGDIIDKLKKELLNKQVEARHKDYGIRGKPHYRKYRIQDISGSSNDKFTLVDKETKKTCEITIAQYFLKEYKVKIRFPNLPCVVDKGRKVPLELCHLIDKQRVLRKMTPDETSAIIKLAAVSPKQYFEQLKKNVEEIHKNSAPLSNFGMEFKPVPIKVEGRELTPLLLTGGTKRDIRPNDGQYNVNSDRFFKPAKVNKWGMLFLECSQMRQNAAQSGYRGEQFSSLYCREGRSKGVLVNEVLKEHINNISIEQDERALKGVLTRYFKHINKSKIDHVIMVLSERCPDWIYRYLQYLEASQQEGRQANENWTRISCVRYKNYWQKIINGRDNGKMFIANLWLKYNTKLGGINFVLKDDKTKPFLQDGCLFVSVDVCHPAPGDKLIQSVAAVVGMWDLTNANFSYCTRIRVQKKVRVDNSTIEEVGDIGIMVGEVLDAYQQRKKKLPGYIMILRDGVSEGQFKIVLQSELVKVNQLVQNKYSLLKLPLPKISCLVVQKRHRVRFMREEPVKTRRGDDDHNIQPGTVVDSGIVHPNDFSFYIAPHKAIQGTSRAAHIYIISNDIQFTQDQAQEMVHALSYLSPRCTKSTSIPTPVNLADLAAERGKNIVISWNDDHREKLSEDERLKKLNGFLTNLADPNYKNTLFYV